MPRILQSLPRAAAVMLAALPCATSVRAQGTAPELEGAIGLLVHSAPDFMGAGRRHSKLTPGIYLRWGRFSVTNASGFVTRSNDEVVRGLGVEIGGSERYRATLGLRYDGGRRESSSPELQGLGSIKATVRARLGLKVRIDEHWRADAAWTVDAFGRGGGNVGEASLQREQRFSPHTTWAAGASVSLAGDRYLQSWFGVTPEQSARSGHAVYEPRFGLRDVALFAHLRSQVAPRWVLLGGLSVTRLVGPAADSPLVRKPTSLAVNGGVAWSF